MSKQGRFIKKDIIAELNPKQPTMDHKEFARLYQKQSRGFKIGFSTALLVFSLVGIYATDKLEEMYPSKARTLAKEKVKIDADGQWKKDVEKELESQ